MIYTINYNDFKLDRNRSLEELGAKLVTTELDTYYEIELNTHEEMEALWFKANKLVDDKFVIDLLIMYDGPCIFLHMDSTNTFHNEIIQDLIDNYK